MPLPTNLQRTHRPQPICFMDPLCGGSRLRGMGMDLLMVILVVGFYLFAAALVAWLDRI
jgi:hypothetical protein